MVYSYHFHAFTSINAPSSISYDTRTSGNITLIFGIYIQKILHYSKLIDVYNTNITLLLFL
jgi:hypothetical protein